MSEGIVVQDELGVIIQHNPAALKILGLSSDELYGRTSMDPNWRAIKEDGSSFPGEEHPAMVSLRTGKPVLGVVMGLILPTSEMRWIRINSAFIFSNSKKRVLSTFADITSQYKMTDELDYISQNLKELFFVKNNLNSVDRKEIIFQNKEIFNFLNDNSIISVTDKYGKIINVNENFLKISGFSKQELIGNNFELLNSNMHEKDFFRNLWETILSGGTWRGEIYNFKKDKTLFVISSNIFPLKDTNDKILYFLAFSTDVTESSLNSIRLKEAQKTAKIGSWEFNLENFSQIWSEEHYKIFEIPVGQDPEKLYQIYRSKIHPEDLKDLDFYLQRAINEGIGFVFNHRVFLDSGKRIKFVQGICRVVKDKDNKSKILFGTCQDRSDFVKLQEENKLLLSMLKIGLWKYNINEDKLYWNQAMFNLYEISPDEFDGSISAWSKLIKSEKESFVKDFKDSITNDKDYFSILEISVKFSRRKFIGNRAIKTEFGTKGNIILFGLSWDNTTSSLNENLISQQKLLIESILHNIPCMVFVKDFNEGMKYKLFNKAGEELLGVQSKNVIGKTDYDIYSKSVADLNYEMDNKIFEIGKVHEISKEKIETKLGTKWLKTFRVPTYTLDGNPDLLIGVSLDISNELLQEEKLKKLLDENIAILRSTKLSIITTDLSGIITSFNEESEKILMYKSLEVVQKKNVLEFFNKNELNAVFQENYKSSSFYNDGYFSLLIQSAEKGFYEEKQWSYIGKNGKNTQVKLNFSVLLDNNNIKYGYMLIAKDITNEILIQDKLNEERAKSVHNSKLTSLGELSASIMHEINNPLSIISSSIQIIKKGKDNSETNEQRFLQIEKAVQRIIKIVSGLKRFSRVTAGDAQELLYISDIIKEVIIITEGKIKENSIELRINIVSEGKILGDFVELEQVLINLINNSADAIKNLEEKWITLNLFNESQQVVLQVIDSGAGIPIELQEKIFNPFFTTKPKGIGTGLGLSISKSILERHRGVLDINRNFKNTCFELRFPKAVYNE